MDSICFMTDMIENIDKWVDDIAEKIFMASGEAEQLDYNILRPELVNTDLTESIRQLLEKIEQLKAENAEPEGIRVSFRLLLLIQCTNS